MRNDFRSYSSINKAGPKVQGQFKIAFGEYPKLSTLSLTVGEGREKAIYDFGHTGTMTRSRRNPMGDLRTEEAIAREAAKLLKDSEFVRSTLKVMQEKKYNITTKDVKAFRNMLESRFSIRESDSLTGKLMGGS